MTEGSRLKEISFDLYERYILLEAIGKLFRPAESTYRVLDVGGHTPAFWPGFPSLAGVLIPDARVAVVDMISTGGLQDYVQASGSRRTEAGIHIGASQGNSGRPIFGFPVRFPK
jgi:hypothetical protein